MNTPHPETAGGTIILLNGTSSAGKSTLARALQEQLDQPYLHVDGDYFWQLYPAVYFDRRPDEIYRVWRGRFLPACYRSLASLAGTGLNVIIDEVLTKPMTLTWLQEALKGYSVLFVGLHCGLEELERRERQRSDRRIGLARFQFPNIHIHGRYDVEVDTEHNDPVSCALQIKDQLTQQNSFTRFWQAVEQPLPD